MRGGGEGSGYLSGPTSRDGSGGYERCVDSERLKPIFFTGVKGRRGARGQSWCRNLQMHKAMGIYTVLELYKKRIVNASVECTTVF